MVYNQLCSKQSLRRSRLRYHQLLLHFHLDNSRLLSHRRRYSCQPTHAIYLYSLPCGWSGRFTTSEGGKCSKDKEIMCFATRPVETFEVIDDLVVDRGPSPTRVSLLESFGIDKYLLHHHRILARSSSVSTPYTLSQASTTP
ncbi:uncharacterized protein HD556DRAFT_716473 [Suillus plorans]|uniref:Uncharacterized protein n=1 Tax=Suillus plorans TaxID=116603 RepID=A0A9P7DTY1_9AGAM|nr:uncharacterized protein HD556DRAFT_716473 [Suillus plorans]KAG1802828.1 hypothetical protein HD556DRAFT_716473 [Suillus plorans]